MKGFLTCLQQYHNDLQLDKEDLPGIELLPVRIVQSLRQFTYILVMVIRILGKTSQFQTCIVVIISSYFNMNEN